MPCFLTECDTQQEAVRFGAALFGLYGYHFVVDTAFIRPVVGLLVRKGWLAKEKTDKMRESLYKNAAVGAFHLMGLYIGWNQSWFMNKEEYFTGFPYTAPEDLRWYYMIYLAFWFQSIDFMLNLTNNHYTVKRKDNAEMLLHHFATISLMIFSYTVDLTKIGMCVLMIHDINDLLLETAKVFVYLEWEPLANVFFGTFALVWFLVRWGFYSYNILHSAYAYAYTDIVAGIMKDGTYMGIHANVWWSVWVIFTGFLFLLLVLHVYWGVLIVKMVIKALSDGNVEKDIRSDSEDEASTNAIGDADDKDEAETPAPAESGRPKRRRAPKAE